MTNHFSKHSYGSRLSDISDILRLRGGGRGKGGPKGSPPNSPKQGGGPSGATVTLSQNELKKMLQEAAAKAVSDALAQQTNTQNQKIANLQRDLTNLQNSNNNSLGSENTGGTGTTPIEDKSFLPVDWKDAVALDTMITTWKTKWSVTLDNPVIICFRQELHVHGALLAYLYESKECKS